MGHSSLVKAVYLEQGEMVERKRIDRERNRDDRALDLFVCCFSAGSWFPRLTSLRRFKEGHAEY